MSEAVSSGSAECETTSDAEATLFGFPPVPARVRIRPRARAWRVTGALRWLGLFLVIAPVVAIVPPHAPWAIGALVGGAVLARRRFQERFTLEGIEAVCPRCGTQLSVKPSRLRTPHPLPCDGCHHTASLKLPEGWLERIARA